MKVLYRVDGDTILPTGFLGLGIVSLLPLDPPQGNGCTLARLGKPLRDVYFRPSVHFYRSYLPPATTPASFTDTMLGVHTQTTRCTLIKPL